MTKKYILQADILEKLKRKELSQLAAARLLNFTTRHIRRKLKSFLANGIESLVHGNKGKTSNRKMPKKLRSKIIELMQTKYKGFGPTFAAEKMAELENISIKAETHRQLLIKNGLWMRHRKRKKHRQWRKPKDFLGEMVQFDGSIHNWTEDEKWTLLKFVDDATRKILWMEFAKSESWRGVATSTINYFLDQGKPLSIYVDRGKVFKVNLNNEENERLTQYQRSLQMLGVELIFAMSPQAKGRIERSFHTDQDRLIKELKLAGIKNMKQANQFIQDYYIPKMNQKFAIAPAKPENLHQKIDQNNLHNIFCLRTTRTVRNDWTIQYNQRLFQIEDSRPAIVRPKDLVTINQRLNGSIYISIRSTVLDFKEIKERSQRFTKKKAPLNKLYKPAANHPWRSYAPFF